MHSNNGQLFILFSKISHYYFLCFQSNLYFKSLKICCSFPAAANNGVMMKLMVDIFKISNSIIISVAFYKFCFFAILCNEPLICKVKVIAP